MTPPIYEPLPWDFLNCWPTVMVRSPCLSVVQVLDFLTGVFPKQESEQAIQLGSQPNWVSVLANQRGKVGVRSWVSGFDHMRRHVICQWAKGDHVICHVTCLGASEDYTSQDATWNWARHNMWPWRHLERRRWIATRSTITRGSFKGKLHVFREVQ